MFPSLPHLSHKLSVNCGFLSWNTSLDASRPKSEWGHCLFKKHPAQTLALWLLWTQMSVRKSWWEERNTEELTCERTSQDHWFTHGWNILCKSTVWRLTTLFVKWVFGRHISFSFTASFKSAEVHWDREVWFHYLNCIFLLKIVFFALSKIISIMISSEWIIIFKGKVKLNTKFNRKHHWTSVHLHLEWGGKFAWCKWWTFDSGHATIV